MNAAPPLHSRIYEGSVRHRRFAPKPNEFRYGVFFCYLDLAELPGVFDRHWLWSARRPNLAWWRRADYLGDPATPLDDAVRQCVAAKTGVRPTGPIRLLTHLRYGGHCFNPVSFYYCFDAAGETVETIVAEITNTPWKERHRYVLPAAKSLEPGPKLRWRFGKEFHVSPFMAMDHEYDWRFSPPGPTLTVHMENQRADGKHFDATLTARARPITSRELARVLLRYPLMTAQVVAGIHWQAARLWWKGVPYQTHPKNLPATPPPPPNG